ncbi:hypothetical protein [Halarchaeum sp. P4]|uniref:hypothetical protein n=1 Tax=Halarchaeum sp. P4 TaxID=3421639 RepID=UPI003EBCCABF
MSLDAASVDTSEAFLDTCVLLNYTLDGVDTAIKLFDDHTAVGKITSENARGEFQSVCDRRADVVEKLREAVREGRPLDEVDITEFGWLSPNDEGYFGSLLAELDGAAPETVLERLNEEKNILEAGEITLFKQPEQRVEVIEVEETGKWKELHDKLSYPVGNSNDQDLLCDATVWHRDGGSGTFISEDSSDITSPDPPGDAGTVSDRASLFDLPSGGPDDINFQISLVYSEAVELDILTTKEFLALLE